MKYPDLVGAYKKGLKMVRNGERHLNIYYVNHSTTNRDNTVLHVSDLGYAYDLCPRQLYLKLNSADKKDKHYGEEIMLMHGDLIHIETAQILQYGLDDYWTIEGIEIPVNDTLPGDMVGRTDMILRGRGGERIIVDFKTSRGGNFKYLDSTGVGDEKQAQVRGYIYAKNADCGILFFIDREGQNGVRQFLVERNDDKFWEDYKAIHQIRTSEPPKMMAGLKININKGDNSIYLNSPWQCDYCDYCDVSCEGALPPKLREINGIVAKEDSEGNIYPYKDDYDDLIELIKKLREEC